MPLLKMTENFASLPLFHLTLSKLKEYEYLTRVLLSDNIF